MEAQGEENEGEGAEGRGGGLPAKDACSKAMRRSWVGLSGGLASGGKHCREPLFRTVWCTSRDPEGVHRPLFSCPSLWSLLCFVSFFLPSRGRQVHK